LSYDNIIYLKGTVHFIQQPQVNIASLRSNGVCYTSSGTPLSSVRQVPSTTTTTTTTTPAVKSKKQIISRRISLIETLLEVYCLNICIDLYKREYVLKLF
jgi:hypothetical protein